jgi:pimeloyl-ACP methyl ester carboxylesterase
MTATAARRAFSEFGDRRNPPIVFLHGIRLGRGTWAQHARALASRFHVITVDLPGHGALVGERFSRESFGELFGTILDEACERPPLIVGYSLGGYVAMEFAAAHPERTHGLALLGCTLDMHGWKHWPPELGAHLARFMPPQVVNSMIRSTVYMTLPPALASVVNEIPFNYNILTETTALTRETRFLERIAGYRKPVLIANGELDLVFRMDERRFLKRLPQAQLRLIERADHTAPMSHARELTQIVDDFATRAFSSAG